MAVGSKIEKVFLLLSLIKVRVVFTTGGARGVRVIVVGNGNSDTSSNLGRG